MNYGIVDFLRLLGSLGVFLYGMKLMSEALQKVAGARMREILAAMTSNRVKGVFTGILITGIIQSSTATTVMVVSFVNAGMLSLIESIGVIMGANVGTTFTAWIFSIFGFSTSMAAISLPLIGLSLPFLFSSKRSRKSLGELVIGIGLLFIGLEYLKDAVPNLDENPEIFQFLKDYTNLGYGSYLLFLGIGTLLTIIIQSSSATMALTLVMCHNGWVSFDIATAMVLGENIGTTVTANLAAMMANTVAKRAAFAHFFFNFFGVLWLMSVYPFFLEGLSRLCVHVGIGNPMSTNATEAISAMPMALSLFHTVFNTLNVVVLIWAVKPLAALVTKLIPSKVNQEDTFKLQHIKIGLLSTPDASMFQAKQELALYGRSALKMFKEVMEGFDMPTKEYAKRFEHLTELEDESDKVEVEIADYLTKVSESKLSTDNTRRLRAMFKMVSDIESVADSSLNVAKAINRRNEQNVVFPDDISHKVKQMMQLVEEALSVMCDNLAKEYSEVLSKKANELESAVNNYRTILKQEHLLALEEKRYGYQVGILYSDLFSECERVGDYAINITEAICEIAAAN
ncbi:hypothetical protein FACS1894199_11150 [Bacteroidia bacterium]|nr:hypothetical protein FACS1894199_11150 [Bacteroidia bacterium]